MNIQEVKPKTPDCIPLLYLLQMNKATAKRQAQLQHRGYQKSFKHKKPTQIVTHIQLNPRREEGTSMTVRSRREAAVLQVKTKWRSTKVSRKNYLLNKHFNLKKNNAVIQECLTQSLLCIKLVLCNNN